MAAVVDLSDGSNPLEVICCDYICVSLAPPFKFMPGGPDVPWPNDERPVYRKNYPVFDPEFWEANCRVVISS